MVGPATTSGRAGHAAHAVRAVGRWLVAVLVACGMFLSSAMVNPALHHLIDGDSPEVAASISSNPTKPLALAAHDVGGKTSDTKAPAGMICSGHCAAHFAGTLPIVVADISVTPVRVSWPSHEALLRAAWRPFSLERPPRV